MNLHESGQMYLESIYVLSKEKGFVRSIDVCDHLGYSKPSVSRAMHLLIDEGYLTMEPDGHLTLTDRGLEVAETMYARHIVLSRALVMLGVDPDTASEDACRIEHVISEKSFSAISAYLSKISDGSEG